MLTVIIILWILWCLCRPWYNGCHRPPMWHRHYHHHAPMWHHHASMGSFHSGGDFGGAFGGSGHTMGGGAGRGRR